VRTWSQPQAGEKIGVKAIIKAALRRMGYEIRRIPPPASAQNSPFATIPDAQFYNPLFSPWLGYKTFKRYLELARPYTLVSADRCYVLYTLASQALSLHGDFWECGVYRGGTARLLAELLAERRATSSKLHLFDTFEGMPDTDPERDVHRAGDFADTSLAAVQKRVGRKNLVVFHKGFIPDTFKGMEDVQIAFAHVDVDIYRSVWDCCAFIVPRLMRGGFIVFDDYGFPTCPGARQAVDEFFSDRPEQPLVLPTGQAVIYASG